MSKRISRSEEAAAMAAVITELLDVSRSLVGIAVYSVNAAPVDITVTQYRTAGRGGLRRPENDR